MSIVKFSKRGELDRENQKPQKIPKDPAIAVRELFQKKLDKMLKIGFADSDSANMLMTFEDGHVGAHMVNERAMLSQELRY